MQQSNCGAVGYLNTAVPPASVAFDPGIETQLPAGALSTTVPLLFAPTNRPFVIVVLRLSF